MKTFYRTLLVIGLVLSARATEPTLEETQKELALVRARLELVEAKLSLAAKEAALKGAPASIQEWSAITESAPAKVTIGRDQWVAVAQQEQEKVQRSDARAQLKRRGTEYWNTMSAEQKQFALDRLGGVGQPNDKLLVEVGIAKKITESRLTSAETAVAAEEGIASAQEKEGETVEKTIFSGIKDEVFFRNVGLSFSAGYGVVTNSGGDFAVGTVIGRWNVRQAKAVHWYNDLTAKASGEGYKAVPYYGMNRTELVDWYKRAHGQALPDQHSILTAWGPFLGGTVAGEKIDIGSGEERPYLVGLSLGFGFSTEAASLFYIDLGATISPKRGFDGSKPYVGFSADLALLTAFWGKIRPGK